MEGRIRVLVVEDDVLIAENLKLSLEDLGYEVIDTSYTYNDAMDQISKDISDIILLDINLGSSNTDDNGLSLAKRINEFNKPFIFITAYSDTDTILEATSLKPSGYLIKPINSAGLFATIQLAIERKSKNIIAPDFEDRITATSYFFVKVGTKTHKVNWNDVIYMQAEKNYVMLHVQNKRIEYPLRGTLTFVLEQLLPIDVKPLFLRINRSFCINIKFITSYDNNFIYSDNLSFENSRYTSKEIQAFLESN